MELPIEQITDGAMHLPISSRAELAEKLVGSLEIARGDQVQQAWAEEAIRRRDEIRSGRIQTIPGEDVLAEVRRMLAQ